MGSSWIRVDVEVLASAERQCRSPMEVRFLRALATRIDRAPVGSAISWRNYLERLAPWTGLGSVGIAVGYRHETSPFEVDFCVAVVDEHHEGAMVGVEIDGHKWHDRTKRQAGYERRRANSILLQGLRIMRFTGSQIYNEPDRCACEVLRLLAREAGLGWLEEAVAVGLDGSPIPDRPEVYRG